MLWYVLVTRRRRKECRVGTIRGQSEGLSLLPCRRVDDWTHVSCLQGEAATPIAGITAPRSCLICQGELPSASIPAVIAARAVLDTQPRCLERPYVDPGRRAAITFASFMPVGGGISPAASFYAQLSPYINIDRCGRQGTTVPQHCTF